MPSFVCQPHWTVRPMLAGLLALMCVAPAAAHEVNVFASVDGRSISGRAKMVGGSPIKRAPVTAFDPAGEILSQTLTDDSGQFTLPLEFRCDHRIEVDAGEGHLGRHTVEAAELPNDLSSRGPHSESSHSSEVAHSHSHSQSHPHSHSDLSHDHESEEDRLDAIDKQLQALRRDIDQYQTRLRIQDILGGIGYILGLAGLAYYLSASRKSKQAKER